MNFSLAVPLPTNFPLSFFLESSVILKLTAPVEEERPKHIARRNLDKERRRSMRPRDGRSPSTSRTGDAMKKPALMKRKVGGQNLFSYNR